MVARYFKKYDPRQKLLLSTGAWFSFPLDGEYGAISTQDSFLVQEFESAIRNQRGGIAEITEAEYQDLKKKPKPFKKFEVEKVSPQLYRKLKRFGANVGRVVDEVTGTVVDEFKNISEPVSGSDYRPGSRKAA